MKKTRYLSVCMSVRSKLYLLVLIFIIPFVQIAQAVEPDGLLYSKKSEERASTYAAKADVLAQKIAKTKDEKERQSLMLQKQLLLKLKDLPDSPEKPSLDLHLNDLSARKKFAWKDFEQYLERYVNLIREAEIAGQTLDNTNKQMQTLHSRLVALAEESPEEDILQLQHAFQVRKFTLQAEIDRQLKRGLEVGKKQYTLLLDRVAIEDKMVDEQLDTVVKAEKILQNLEDEEVLESTRNDIRLEQQESVLASYLGQDLTDQERKKMYYEQLKLLELQADKLSRESKVFEARINLLEEQQKVVWFRLFDRKVNFYDLAYLSSDIEEKVRVVRKKSAKAQVRKYTYEKELSSLRGGNAVIGPMALELSETLNKHLSEIFTLLSGIGNRAELLEDKGALLDRAIGLKQSALGSMVTKTREATDMLFEKTMAVLKHPLLSYSGMSLSLLLILQILCLLFLGIIANRLYGYAVMRMGRKRKWTERTIQLVHAIGKYPFIFIIAMIILSVVGINTRSLALVAGALSVGIGFGMQTIVNNLVSGIILLFDKSIRPGDYISLGDCSTTGGYRGNVVQMNIRATVLRTNDNINIIVPNADLMASQVVNWTYSDEKIRFRIPFSAAYGSDLEFVKAVVKEAIIGLPVVLSLPEPKIWLTAHAESSLAFVAAIWVEGQNARMPAQTFDIILSAIYSALNAHGIEIPFPQMDLRLRQSAQKNVDFSTISRGLHTPFLQSAETS